MEGPGGAGTESGGSLVMGRISGLYGIGGWVRVYSYTEPREHIIHYSPWWIETDDSRYNLQLEAGRRHGKGIIAKFQGIDDRDAAARLLGHRIAVDWRQLEPLGDDEFYWVELTGLKVVNLVGEELGIVESLLETGAHDVLVVKGERERLLPFVRGRIIKAVELDRGRITVDWEADY